MNELRATVDRMIEEYRTQAGWSVEVQIVLRCIDVLWMETFTSDRLSALSRPLVGEHLSTHCVSLQLGKMLKAGLLRTRRVSGVRVYEINLPL